MVKEEEERKCPLKEEESFTMNRFKNNHRMHPSPAFVPHTPDELNSNFRTTFLKQHPPSNPHGRYFEISFEFIIRNEKEKE
ncbi:hypothetical protein CEXT_714501 [Caerostris extrusa]|uniref:Uncharacterized protein n=1 Tax=Caerostris extrusa TaxID=172846 RepID=A0AAV4PMY8_CAEEX|nr:hypothetical protein CEXT_714501 [Caerostris extrusa]